LEEEQVKTLIIPDIHGHYDTLKSLLREAGVLDNQNHRVDGWRVIQIGDLANCVHSDINGDVECLKTVGDWIDTMLIGNHEHGHFGGPTFGGFYPAPEVRTILNSIDRMGHLAPAALVDSSEGEILVTHAGYVPSEGIESAVDGFNYAVEKWIEDKRHPLFSAIGTERGGWNQFGGILWSDWSEAKAHEFNQILGHTPQKKGVQKREYSSTGKWSINIDCGAKHRMGCTGVIVDENGDLSYVSTPMSGNHW
jgi:hypothetical protein